MERIKVNIDFNEMLEDDLCLLSKNDDKVDLKGNTIKLTDGMELDVSMEDEDENGNLDPLIASGRVELNTDGGWSSHVKWCIRIDEKGIRRESEI